MFRVFMGGIIRLYTLYTREYIWIVVRLFVEFDFG